MAHKIRNQQKRKNQYESIGFEGAELIRRSEWNFPGGSGTYPLFPFMLEETIRHNRFRFKELYCRFFYAVLLTEGKLRYRNNDSNLILEPGSLLLIPPGCDYTFDSETTGGYRKLVLELNGIHLSSICTALGLGRFQVLSLEEPETTLHYFLSVRDALDCKNPADVPDLLGGVYAFLIRISEAVHRGNGRSDLLFQAQKMLESRSDLSLSIAEIADRLGIGVSSLNRIFRNRLNISPIQYRNGCLIEQARDLLIRSSMSVKEIAAELRFCNQFYFCQLFRELSGCPPSVYRKNFRNSIKT